MRPPLALALAAILPACAAPAVGSAVPGGGQVPIEATFSSINALVFTPKCASCHSGANNIPLNLTAEAAYAALVNAPSTQTTEMLLVTPRDLDQSYLMLKLSGIGDMPIDGPLPDEELAAIAAWILDGAPND